MGELETLMTLIKALALGADYVMIGSLFAKMYESSGTKVYDDGIKSSKKGMIKFPEEYFE